MSQRISDRLPLTPRFSQIKKKKKKKKKKKERKKEKEKEKRKIKKEQSELSGETQYIYPINSHRIAPRSKQQLEFCVTRDIYVSRAIDH